MIKYFPFIGVLLSIICCAACLKQRNEYPNQNKDISIVATHNVSSLQAIMPTQGTVVRIDNDWILGLVVRANDETGNWSDQLIAEDTSGGLAILINENSLFTRYPVSKRVFLRLKGLYLGNDQGALQIGSTAIQDNNGNWKVSKITPSLLSNHLVATNITILQPPIEMSIQQLEQKGMSVSNRLVKINNIEFANPTYDDTYASPTASATITLRDCEGHLINLRTSNYARFASAATPYGKGSIVALYSQFKGEGQLMIRDTNDVLMTDQRCDGSVSAQATPISIDSLRHLYKGTDTTVGNYFIRGIVISNNEHKNFGNGNIILQDATAGIMVYFGNTSAALPQMGDSVTIQVNATKLIKYNGVLEITNIKPSRFTVWATNKTVAPITLTIASLNANFQQYESRLVRINNAKITTKGNYSGSNTLSDATGNIILFTSSSATFAQDPVPNFTQNFQGIATYYGITQELKIRHPSIDVF